LRAALLELAAVRPAGLLGALAFAAGFAFVAGAFAFATGFAFAAGAFALAAGFAFAAGAFAFATGFTFAAGAFAFATGFAFAAGAFALAAGFAFAAVRAAVRAGAFAADFAAVLAGAFAFGAVFGPTFEPAGLALLATLVELAFPAGALPADALLAAACFGAVALAEARFAGGLVAGAFFGGTWHLRCCWIVCVPAADSRGDAGLFALPREYPAPVPELPEIEALRRALDQPVQAAPIEQAGPAHIATLKTFDPPLSALEGMALLGVRRRAKRLLFPTRDEELVLMVHLMSAGRIRYLRPGAKGPKTPAFRLRFADGGELVLTEGGPKKRAGVWLLRPVALAAELAQLGPEADEVSAAQLGSILRSDSRRLHAALRDQRLLAGIGRAWANEILHAAKLSPYALTTQLADAEVVRLAEAMHAELARGLELREAGAGNDRTYRVHNRLGEPCHVCGTPLARVDFEQHTIFYCPTCQTGGRLLKDRRLSRLLR
jgi:formamidopyrimidine-DNA glycosylase